MSRIFFTLASFAVLLLVINIVLGLTGGNYNAVAYRYRVVFEELQALKNAVNASQDNIGEFEQQLLELGEQLQQLEQSHTMHLLFGLAASLVTVLVNCITVTYFIGTNRWCKEVAATYQLDEELVERANSIKRKTFPWALSGIVLILLIILLGGAALPFNRIVGDTESWVVPHYAGAIVGTLLIAWSFLVQAVKIGANSEVIHQLLLEVGRIRAEQEKVDSPNELENG